jgi:hypothetical protein
MADAAEAGSAPSPAAAGISSIAVNKHWVVAACGSQPHLSFFRHSISSHQTQPGDPLQSVGSMQVSSVGELIRDSGWAVNGMPKLHSCPHLVQHALLGCWLSVCAQRTYLPPQVQGQGYAHALQYISLKHSASLAQPSITCRLWWDHLWRAAAHQPGGQHHGWLPAAGVSWQQL